MASGHVQFPSIFAQAKAIETLRTATGEDDAEGRWKKVICAPLRPVSTTSVPVGRNAVHLAGDSSIDDPTPPPLSPARSALQSPLVGAFRGYASETLASINQDLELADLPATVAAVKNPTSKIVYDVHYHERYPPGDPSKRAFACMVLTGGRFIYASLLRLFILKFVLSMSPSKDVLALASLEVDLSGIEPGSTVTVKWCGKPVFIRRRTEADVQLANSVDVATLRDPQTDSERVKNPEWLVVVGVCTHLGCIPLPNAGDFGG